MKTMLMTHGRRIRVIPRPSLFGKCAIFKVIRGLVVDEITRPNNKPLSLEDTFLSKSAVENQ